MELEERQTEKRIGDRPKYEACSEAGKPKELGVWPNLYCISSKPEPR